MNSQLLIGILIGLVIGQYLWPLIMSIFYSLIGGVKGIAGK